MTESKIDRYVNFQGINCDGQASCLMDYINKYTKNSPFNSSWSEYFQAKLTERISIGQDELHFICSQMNNIYSLFEEYEDTEALDLLEKIEEECC